MKIFEERYSNVLLFGDFNSRTRNSEDYIDIDQSDFHETDLDCVFEELSEGYKVFENKTSQITINRNNNDVWLQTG